MESATMQVPRHQSSAAGSSIAMTVSSPRTSKVQGFPLFG